MNRPSKILCVHQGYELYGSDRTFISSLFAIRSEFPDSEILAFLPKDGDLSEALRAEGFDVCIGDIWIARRSYGFMTGLFRALKFPFSLLRAIREIRKHDLCYINTSVVFDYAVAARFVATPVVIHVHEIPTGFAMNVIDYIMRFSKGLIIYNSEATMRAFERAGDTNSRVVLNGVRRPSKVSPDPCTHDDRSLRVLMIGRLNSWKGQDLLLRAVSLIPQAIAKHLEIRFVGASFEDGRELEELKQLVSRLKLVCDIAFDGYLNDPESVYSWADVVVVPSKKPEPFGLVAVEAMSHGRPVVAANHGGLKEIVVDSVSGLLFKPNDAQDLAHRLTALIEDNSLAISLGKAGRQVFEKKFEETRYRLEIAEVLRRYYEHG